MNRKGIGLGLSLCKSIVEAHRGEITIRKNLPKGTVVSFYVPADEEMI
jgi:two-component system sensor histidine kinase KdpD